MWARWEELGLNKRFVSAVASTFQRRQLIGYVIQNKRLPPAKSLEVWEDAPRAEFTVTVVDEEWADVCGPCPLVLFSQANLVQGEHPLLLVHITSVFAVSSRNISSFPKNIQHIRWATNTKMEIDALIPYRNKKKLWFVISYLWAPTWTNANSSARWRHVTTFI